MQQDAARRPVGETDTSSRVSPEEAAPSGRRPRGSISTRSVLGDAAAAHTGEVRALFEGTALAPFAAGTASAATSAWLSGENELGLVLDAEGFESKLAEAAAWAERITLCLTAPQSQRATLRGWRELLAHSAKCDGIYLRRAEATEGWLLHRLHDTGALRLVEGGGKQVAANLLLFARGAELRALFSHIPLERAVSGAGFGALLAFRAASSSEIARASRAQAESWASLCHIPTGNEVDVLALGQRRAERVAAPGGPLRVVSELAELEAGLQRFESEGSLSWRTQGLGLQVQLQQRDRAPFLLTLHAGSAWASGNALLLAGSDGQLALGWRGGLLGPARSRADLLWSEARLSSLAVEDTARGPAQRVALVAHTGSALGPQLDAFVREMARLSEVFGVEPPPALGHALADFASLSSRQQTLLSWRALLGLGALDFGVATLTAVQVLREQGYLRSDAQDSAAGVYGSVAELLAQAAESGSAFDRPGVGKIRAIQPELSAYVQDDWLECLLLALPEQAVVGRARALRLA
ncbi:MAG TPA: hypothetical protein VJU61_29355, partial [Polyangiaceae bacterium]|nr:hypothetical protein [Polyangiaceae bacterium]